MKLVELSLELAKQQIFRQSVHGAIPRIREIYFFPLDDAGQIFALRASFSFGVDYVTEIRLDFPVDLSLPDWQERFDCAACGDEHECRWMQ